MLSEKTRVVDQKKLSYLSVVTRNRAIDSSIFSAGPIQAVPLRFRIALSSLLTTDTDYHGY
jgi:hypothetical protein